MSAERPGPTLEREVKADGEFVQRVRRNLAAWLQFDDRDNPPYHPSTDGMIITNRTWEFDNGESRLPDWIREGWSIRSELVPVDQLADAGAVRWEDHAHIDVGWSAQDEFDFGESVESLGVTLLPWIVWWRHPVSDEPLLRLRDDFACYHALIKNSAGLFRHPLDDLVVARLDIQTHPFFEPVPLVEVHESYLRDFLAARQFGLLIRVVADRFGNARTARELGIADMDVTPIAEGTWIQTNTRSAAELGFEGVMGRGTLWRSITIPPYDRPRTDRTPWPYFYERPAPGSTPQFLVNPAGDRAALNSAGCPAYLHFRPEVLQKYLHAPGYRVRFHMRTWGRAHAPGNAHSIDVGINSQGLVNAFAKDLADQRPEEQAYWASFSVTPAGEVCEEMFRTNMMCDPPESSSAFEQLSDALTRLNDAARPRLGASFHSGADPSENEIDRITVGPLTREWRELLELAKTLLGWLVEQMSIQNLRRAIADRAPVDNAWKQIKLIEALLLAEGVSADEASDAIAPLTGVNILRIAAAHPAEADLTKAFSLMGLDHVPDTSRQGWLRCADSVTSALGAIAGHLIGNS